MRSEVGVPAGGAAAARGERCAGNGMASPMKWLLGRIRSPGAVQQSLGPGNFLPGQDGSPFPGAEEGHRIPIA